MENTDQAKQQLLEKYKSMGIPAPISTAGLATTPTDIALAKGATGGKSEMLLKLEAIRKGANRNVFKTFIEKAEPGAVTHPSAPPASIPVHRGGGGAPQQVKKVALETFAPVAKTREELEVERMLNGGGGYSQPAVVYNPENPQAAPTQQQLYEAQIPTTEAYGPPPTVDYQQKLAARLRDKFGVSLQPKQIAETQQNEGNLLSETFVKRQIAELEDRMPDMIMDISEKISKIMVEKFAKEIAEEAAKKTVIKIISEFAKSGKNIIVETNRVKQAEVVSKDKVKIGGKVYKLTEVKEV
jgi:hypothetical protein